MKKYIFGVDIGGTTVKIGLFENSGSLIEKWEIKTRLEENGRYILKDIADSIEEGIARKKISNSDIEGIGIGVPGPVLEDGTVVKCVNLGWGVFNIEKEMAALTGYKVKAGNDANVAALGEMWQGGGKGFNSIVMVTLGTGVGGGIIINGKIVAGSHGAGGEIGHIHMKDGEERTCGCGNHGCLEQYASATGIVNTTKKYLKEHSDEIETKLLHIQNLSAKDIFDAAKESDTVAVKMVHDVGKMLGRALATVACTTDPQAFVIGGGVSKAGSILIESIREYYLKYAFHASREVVFKLAELGNDAGIFGSVYFILKESDEYEPN